MPQTNYRGYREMSRTTVLGISHLVEMKDLAYEDIKDTYINSEWAFDRDKSKGTKYYALNIGCAFKDLDGIYELYLTVSILPIFHILTREKYLLYKLTGLI